MLYKERDGDASINKLFLFTSRILNNTGWTSCTVGFPVQIPGSVCNIYRVSQLHCQIIFYVLFAQLINNNGTSCVLMKTSRVSWLWLLESRCSENRVRDHMNIRWNNCLRCWRVSIWYLFPNSLLLLLSNPSLAPPPRYLWRRRKYESNHNHNGMESRPKVYISTYQQLLMCAYIESLIIEH